MEVTYALQSDIDRIYDYINTTDDLWIQNLWIYWLTKKDEAAFWSPFVVLKQWDEIMWFAQLDYDCRLIRCEICRFYIYPYKQSKPFFLP